MNTLRELTADDIPATKSACWEFIEALKKEIPSQNALPKTEQVNFKVGTLTIHLEMDVVANSIEYGRKAGRMPPTEPIRLWVERRGIEPRKAANGTLPSLATLSYLIAKSIGRRGTKGKHYWADAVKRLEGEWQPKFEDAFRTDLQNYLTREDGDLVGG